MLPEVLGIQVSGHPLRHFPVRRETALANVEAHAGNSNRAIQSWQFKVRRAIAVDLDQVRTKPLWTLEASW